MDEVRKALAVLDDHNVIQKIDRKYSHVPFDFYHNGVYQYTRYLVLSL